MIHWDQILKENYQQTNCDEVITLNISHFNDGGRQVDTHIHAFRESVDDEWTVHICDSWYDGSGSLKRSRHFDDMNDEDLLKYINELKKHS